MKAFFTILVILLSVTIPGFSKVWIITNSGNTYIPNAITINLGDTVKFEIGGTHNVLEVDQNTWNANLNTSLQGGFSLPYSGGFLYPAQLATGIHYYVCEPHAKFGMKGTITVQEATAIEENQFTPLISVYPNPAVDVLSIKANNTVQWSAFTIIDQTGRQVMAGKLTDEITTLNIEHLVKGIYLLQVGELRKQTFKFIKK